MGSLMAGWDTPFHDPKEVKLERNKSVTNEGIEAWKSQNKDENIHVELKSIKEPEKKLKRSYSLPLTDTRGGSINLDIDVNLEKLIQKKGWWTRSTFAFLNEPPVIGSEGPTYKYASQHHVAKLGTSRAGHNTRREINA